MEKRKITSCVITGASGMIGATLARFLLQSDIQVTAVVRPGSKKTENLPVGAEGLTILECALEDYEKLSMKDIQADAFFHFAWESPAGAGRNDQALQDRNVRFTEETVRMAKECRAKVYIGAGSQAQYGFAEDKLREDTEMKPVTAYGIAKMRAEEKSRKLCREAGIDHIWTRILSVYGPFDNAYSLIMQAVRGVLDHSRPTFTKGEQVWDLLYSEDCAEAIFRLAKSGRNGRAYVLGSGKPELLRNYILTVRDTLDKSAPIGLGERPYNENQVMYLAADITALTEDTGYIPSTPFEEGIRRTAAWIRETGDRK